jgi:hypothetical protein
MGIRYAYMVLVGKPGGERSPERSGRRVDLRERGGGGVDWEILDYLSTVGVSRRAQLHGVN